MVDRVEGRACRRYNLRIRSALRGWPSMIVRTVTAAALATVLLIACQDGAGTPGTPGPAWAPPAWVHGTWTGTGATGSLTMEASARNVQVFISTGGAVTVTVDMAKLAEEGIATIEYQGGIYSGTRFWGQTDRRRVLHVDLGRSRSRFEDDQLPVGTLGNEPVVPPGRYIGPTPVTRS